MSSVSRATTDLVVPGVGKTLQHEHDMLKLGSRQERARGRETEKDTEYTKKNGKKNVNYIAATLVVNFREQPSD